MIFSINGSIKRSIRQDAKTCKNYSQHCRSNFRSLKLLNFHQGSSIMAWRHATPYFLTSASSYASCFLTRIETILRSRSTDQSLWTPGSSWCKTTLISEYMTFTSYQFNQKIKETKMRSRISNLITTTKVQVNFSRASLTFGSQQSLR